MKRGFSCAAGLLRRCAPRNDHYVCHREEPARPTWRARGARIALTAALACVAASAGAQTYPVKPIRMINPFSPGGSLDLVARTLAKHMSAELGQQVIVDNRPGAGGTTGIEQAAKSPPDGYTLLAVQTSLVINAVLQQKV